ncbi:MAG TPA: class I SAM-dependent methyltransferase family protein [Euryarchaeota archaeon]|nr:class I SAM-dependent methyltransferase family protein [Euryarchaeota archaeon]
MFVARVHSSLAHRAIREMLSRELVDRDKKIGRTGDEVLIPLIDRNIPFDIIRRYDAKVEQSEDRRRSRRGLPFNEVVNRLRSEGVQENQISDLPDKWESLGDVLIIRIPDHLVQKQRQIAAAYAEVLGARTVLRDMGIFGAERVPHMEILFGDDAETVHLENGVRYCFDASKIMFSSGNIDERIRMAGINVRGEKVLDMFAGIGYFSLPVAVYGEPEKIYSCEIRKHSFDYLVRNIRLNDVEDRVIPVLGDNRDFDPPEMVDRIIMGYLKDTHKFIPKAVSHLKSGGIIHYHENCPNELFPRRFVERIRESAGEEWDIEIIFCRNVKSYSPGVSHIVVDVRCSLR